MSDGNIVNALADPKEIEKALREDQIRTFIRWLEEQVLDQSDAPMPTLPGDARVRGYWSKIGGGYAQIVFPLTTQQAIKLYCDVTPIYQYELNEHYTFIAENNGHTITGWMSAHHGDYYTRCEACGAIGYFSDRGDNLQQLEARCPAHAGPADLPIYNTDVLAAFSGTNTGE